MRAILTVVCAHHSDATSEKRGGARHGTGSIRRAPGPATAVASHGGRPGRALPRALRGLQSRRAAAPAEGRRLAGHRQARWRRIFPQRRGRRAAARRSGSPPGAGACVSVVLIYACDLFCLVFTPHRPPIWDRSGLAGPLAGLCSSLGSLRVGGTEMAFPR